MVYRRNRDHYILVTVLGAFLFYTLTVHTPIPIASADFTYPSTAIWLSSGETSGIFSTGKVIYNITTGDQFKHTYPRITFRSNTSQLIMLGECIADFRLVRVEDNGSLTEIDYARFTLNSINAKEGVFWATTIRDYPSIYRFGVVIWNATDGSTVGRLVGTIYASAEPWVILTMDKEEYNSSDVVGFKLVNRGPPVLTSPPERVYREVNGSLQSVTNWAGPIIDWASIVVSKDQPYHSSIVNSGSIDLSQSGTYRMELDYGPVSQGEWGTASAEFKINSTGVIPPPSEGDKSNWTWIGALIGIPSGLAIFYLMRRRLANTG